MAYSMARLRRIASLARRSLYDPVTREVFAAKVRTHASRKGQHITRSRRLPALPPFPIPQGPIARPALRVATILDGFSALAFGYEWDQHPVPRHGWRAEFETTPPALLFVESAWTGNDRAWRLTMTNTTGPHPDLVAVVQWCRDHRVPTVFWNKEDPPNYGVFVQCAALFDQVFTVDADTIERYRDDLGHQRVQLLPFAAQPRIHTPLRFGDRNTSSLKNRTVAFAGTYFAQKHAERRRQMDLLFPAAQARGLHIFSRMQTGEERYQFPTRYSSAVVGSLPYAQMLAAASVYPVFLNVNSVTTSPTMCARRLFELSAAQTAVLSTPSAAIERFFGETITVVENQEQAQSALALLLGQKEHRDRLALRAHRRVFNDHLYRHRVDTVLESVGLTQPMPKESISAIVPTMRPENVEQLLALLGAQSHTEMEVVLITHGFSIDPTDFQRRARRAGIAHATTREAPKEWTLGSCMNVGVTISSGRYVAKMDDDNTYSPHYLRDLARAFLFTDAQVVGKCAHYVHLAATNAIVLRFPHAEHRYTPFVQGGTLIMPRDVATSLRFEDIPRRVDTSFLAKVLAQGGRVYSADRFNYVSRRASSPRGHTWGITDRDLINRSSQIVGYGDGIEHVTV